jgi:hypothetical protein
MWQVVVTDAVALVAGVLILVALSRLRLLFSALAIGLLAGALVVYLAVDVLLWILRGVREVKMSAEAVVLVIGRNRETRRIGADEIGGIRMTRRLGRRRIVILPRSTEGRTLRKTAISDDAFSREDFAKISKGIANLVRTY